MNTRFSPRSRAHSPLFASVLGPALLLMLAIGTVALTFTGKYHHALIPGAVFLALLIFGRRPHWIYLLIVALIPFWAIRQIGGINIQWPLGLLMLMILALHYLPQKRIPTSVRSDFWPLFIAFVAVFTLSALVSPYPDTAWQNLRWLTAAILFVVFGFAIIDRDLYLHALPKVIIWSITLGSLVSVLDYAVDLPFVPPGTDGYALTSHPNNAAQMAIFAIPLIVHELVYRTNIGNRALLLMTLFINCGAVVVSFSRAGFIVLLVTILILAIEFSRKLHARNTGLVIAAICIILAATALLTPAEYWERQRSLVEWQDSSLKRRTAYIEVGWEAFLESPLLGTGPGTFKDVYPLSQKAAEFKSERESQLRRHAHNGYLELLVGTGLIGLTIFLLILLKSLNKFTRAKRNYLAHGLEELASLTGCYRTSLISVILYLTVGSIIYHKQLLLLFALSQAAWFISNTGDIEHDDADTA